MMAGDKQLLGISNECDKHGCIEEEDDDLTLEEEINYHDVGSDPDSPTILEEPDVKEERKNTMLRMKASDPIPIQRSSPKSLNPAKDVIYKPFPIMRSQSDCPRPRSLDSESVAGKHSKTDKGSPHTQSLEDVSVTNKIKEEKPERFQHHRHSIPGQLTSYLRMCSAADLPKVFGSTSSLFSTAVISGSSSAPELKNAVPPSSSDGYASVPSIRPLETLHNALSLRQLDSFLERMTSASFRLSLTALSKLPSSAGSSFTSGNFSGSQPSALPIASPSSSLAWSGPPSFVSSSGPSSPNSSTLDIWARWRQMTEVDSVIDFSGPGSRNSFSNPPSPHDPRYYNNSL